MAIIASDLDALWLPAVEEFIFATEGVEANVYYNALVCPDTHIPMRPYVVSNRGQALSDCWRWTSDGTDDTVLGTAIALSIDLWAGMGVRENPGQLTPLKSTPLAPLIRLAKKARTVRTVKVLLIGDSLTANGTIESHLNTLATADGNTAITLLGTLGANPNKHEGRAGWSVNLFNTAGSPFVFAGVFDFAQYLATNGIATPDYVGIMLGVNDMAGQSDAYADFDGTIAAFCQAQFAIIDQWILAIHAVNPNIVIGIHTITPPAATQDGFGILTGANVGSERVSYARKRQIWYREQIAWFRNRHHTASKCWLVNTGSALDPVYSFPITTAPASQYATQNVSRINNSVHPDVPGYKQLAGAIWAALKNIFEPAP